MFELHRQGIPEAMELQQIFGIVSVAVNSTVSLGGIKIVQRQCSDISNFITKEM